MPLRYRLPRCFSELLLQDTHIFVWTKPSTCLGSQAKRAFKEMSRGLWTFLPIASHVQTYLSESTPSNPLFLSQDDSSALEKVCGTDVL